MSASASASTEYFDLGTHRRAISTSSPEAQLWFERGLLWTYAFNHEEAVRCFERASAADPQCPMAYWGAAYAAGPNYNKPWEFFDPRDLADTVAKTYAVTQQALALVDKASPAERALIEALPARYPAPEPAEDCMAWNAPYAEAMRAVYRAFGDDLDIATLTAEALMNQTPWQLWDLPSGAPAAEADTTEARELLERGLATPAGRAHPGLLHMYIHLMEMSPSPEQALRAADWLRGLVPDGGHLQHMCTHIDVLCGQYHDVVAWNTTAIAADRKYLAREGAMNFYTLYRVHNLHFQMYGAMFLGQRETELAAANDMLDAIPDELLRVQSPPMADWLEPFVPMKLHVLTRFGRWQELIDAPLPDEPELFCVTTAMLHYAKGLAHAATGQVAEAEQQRALFDVAVGRVPDTRYFQNNVCLDILKVARAMLDGELEYRKGNVLAAFEHLRRAVHLEDTLPYAEPWAWMQPTRHALGALLLEQGQVAEAAAVYRADLGLDDALPRACQHPENVWSLHGYHECLVAQGKTAEARLIQQRLALAQARADVPITASCFCRLRCVC
jgi:tetratricopeptide (TPR) repeat protein